MLLYNQHRDDLARLRGHRNSKSNFKLTLDTPPGLGFVAIPAALLDSRVYELRFLNFLLVEHLRHGRTMNGYLTARYDQLQARRIPRSYIARRINNLVALGLLEVTHQGGYSAALGSATERRDPTLGRLKSRLRPE